MSPEQVRAQPVDHRSDLFSFGIILYEMLTGVHPFRRRRAVETMGAILHEEPEPLAKYLPSSSEQLRETVNQLLAKNPDERTQTVEEVAVRLTELASQAEELRLSAFLRSRLGRRLALVLTAVVAIALIGWWALQTGPTEVGRPVVSSIAVLPLANLSGDPTQEYFADGMTDALITQLGKIGALSVISHTSVMRLKATNKTLAEIAEELNVDKLLEGSTQRVGREVGITVRLIDAATEAQLWSQDYQRDLTNLLALQGEMARAIAQKIAITLTPAEESNLTTTRQVNPETYEAYLRGMHQMSKATAEGYEKGIAYLNEAVDKDPADPRAYAGLALGYIRIGHGSGPSEDAFIKAKAAATRALELDENIAEAHAALADALLYYEWDWVSAEKEFRRSLELNPNLAEARAHYSWYNLLRHDWDEALRQARRAQELDPLSDTFTLWLAAVYRWIGDYDKAIHEAQKTLELKPNHGYAWFQIGNVYADTGKYDEAIAAHQKVAPRYRWALAKTYALAGRREEARQVLAEWERETEPQNPYALALVHTAIGERDEAFQWLEKAYESRNRGMPWLGTNPDFISLHDDPRFQDLIRRMNFPEVVIARILNDTQ
jgi:TolB-like protein